MPEKTDSERLAVIETIVTRLDHQLFGNGQPGQVEILHERISEVGKRVGSLENWKWWLTGMATVVGTLLGYLLR